MHYANGREARNGDKVVLADYSGNILVGILYDAQAGNDYCNGKIAEISPKDSCPNLKECLHFDDVKALFPSGISSEGLAKVPISIPNVKDQQ